MSWYSLVPCSVFPWTCGKPAGTLRTAYRAISTGNWARRGRHPLSGLTPSSLYRRIVSSWIFALFPLYLRCSSLCFGAIAAIACMERICFTANGSRRTRIPSVRRMIATP
jgi:hypothetical protein